MNKCVVWFVRKYKAFNILQNKIDNVVKKSTQMWKLTYGLTIVTVGEKDPIEVKDHWEDDNNDDTVKGVIEMNIDDK